jgi:hypothetical protein
VCEIERSWAVPTTGAFPAAALYACAQLRFLDISNNTFTGVLPAGIVDCLSPVMEDLNLPSNSFDGFVPAAVTRLPALKSLVLDNNRFTDPAAEISELSDLEFAKIRELAGRQRVLASARAAGVCQADEADLSLDGPNEPHRGDSGGVRQPHGAHGARHVVEQSHRFDPGVGVAASEA